MKKILLFISIFILTGCTSNYRELNELGIITAFGIKKIDNEYEVSFQLVNVTNSDNTTIEESPISVIKGTGKTIYDAARSLHLKSSKVFFLSSVQYVILDKSVLTDDLTPIIDYLTRDTRLSLNFLILSSEDDPSLILSSLSEFDISPSNNLYEIISLSLERYGVSYKLTLKDFLSSYLEYGKVPVIPNITLTNINSNNTDEMKKSNTDSYVELKDLIFINNDNEIIHLSKEEILGFNFINNNIKNAVITCNCDNGYFTIETLKSDTSLKLVNNVVNIKTDVEAELVYYGCEEEFDSVSSLNRVTNIIEETIKDYYTLSINKVKDNNTDYLSIGNFIYKKYPKYFDFNSDNWDTSGFNKLGFKYDVNANIYKQGNLKEGIK